MVFAILLAQMRVAGLACARPALIALKREDAAGIPFGDIRGVARRLLAGGFL
ncbi:hypothetical protein HT585_19730 [Ensifer sp. HO-A22]|uniref:Uncharacterized protein n=1 Tax=Ensifer oleiphilus TaxID=2742698 RepID=A0A7Y6Q8R7_9HYPH|nr:hypothetical protein [Ensifer oleiphilus]NVD41109.1 hypothetical protein [Ensifer oleiphilus]